MREQSTGATSQELIEASCGCGDYTVYWPEGQLPPAIDVVCPVCENHFGHGDDPCPCQHDHAHSDSDTTGVDDE